MKKILLIMMVVVFVGMGIGCKSADSGKYSVETNWGKVVKVHQPGDVYTTFSPGTSANDVDGRPWTTDVVVHTATKDNAPLKVTVRVQGRVAPDKVAQYFEKFGQDQKTREEKVEQLVTGAAVTAGRDAIVQHEAYNIFASQDAIQSFMTEKLRVYMSDQIYTELIGDVAIIDKPTFDNADIENAAGRVVAAQKLKQAAEQEKLAAQTILEKNEIQNRIYTSSPQAFELEKLKLQASIAESWSKHSGALVFGNGSGMQIQVPSQGK